MFRGTAIVWAIVLALPAFGQNSVWSPPVYWPAPEPIRNTTRAVPRPLPALPQEDPAKEILFEKMASWVYVETGVDTQQQIRWGKFLNTTTNRKTGWLRAGQFLEGARIQSLDTDKAVLGYRGARQSLFYVPEKPPEPKQKGQARTPEEIAAAQRRYSEFYMKKFMLQGKEYDRQRGIPATQNPHGKPPAGGE